jgi:hypothetical protein
VKQYERRTGNNFGTRHILQRILLVQHCTLHLQTNQGRIATKQNIFRGFLLYFICLTSPISEVKIVVSIVLAQHKRQERKSEERKLTLQYM